MSDPKKLFYYEPGYEEDTEAVYQQLRKHFDDVGIGYRKSSDIENATPEGDIQLLKNLIPIQHAVIAVGIPIDHWGSAEEIAKTLNKEIRYVSRVLYDLSIHGTAMHKRVDGVDYYRIVGQIPGVLEFQLANQQEPHFTDKKMMVPYIGEYLYPAMFDHVPSWRWLPMDSSVVVGNDIMPYDDMNKLIDDADKIAVAPCMCRNFNPNPCKFNEDYDCCFAFNDFAEFYVDDLKVAHYITKDEARELVRKNTESGHIVMMSADSQKHEIVCSCCDDCCTIIAAYKGVNGEGKKKVSAYKLLIDEDLCINCGACADEHCFGGANKMIEGKLTHDFSSCVGCGMCVKNCPEKALILVKKSTDELFVPPEDIFDMYQMQNDARKAAEKKN